MFNWY